MNNSMEKLREIIARLRAPGGCPWDREQTATSLIPSLIEEAYEVVDAIERGHAGDLKEELGDLLINILMQAQIASEQNSFTLDAIASTASEKLIRRHPHVFGESSASSSDAVLLQWEEIKRSELLAKTEKDGTNNLSNESHLDGVARAFPALVRAQKIQKKAAKVGFDWQCPEDVVAKVYEEIAEIEQEMSAHHESSEHRKARLTDEVGDLLFAAVNLSRALSLDAESTLQAATEKFARRFREMERAVPATKKFADLSFDEMNSLWDQVKRAKSVDYL